MRKGESHSRNISHRLAMAVLLVSTVLASRPAAAATDQSILTYTGADREQQLIDGAKKEGAVVFYSGVIVNQALRPIAEGFMKKYPFVKMTYWRAETEDIMSKVSAEERANNVVGDVLEGTGLGEVAVQAGIVQPFTTPILDGYPAGRRDPDHMWAPTRVSYFGTAYNTKMVAPGTEPKSYEDLLDPKWKGKMAWRIGTSTGTPLFITNLRLAWGEDKALAYFKKLKDQKIVNFGSGSARTLVDRVIAGEYPIALNIFAHHPLISKAKGAPVDSVLMDPVPVVAASMQIPKNIPHPYAAMLLVDFILSNEGQQILAKAQYFPAQPDVPSLPELAPVVPKIAGVPENFISPKQFNDMNDSSQKIYDELFR
jgi:ABC-type Fe3+ transport system substrate-binding protein